MENFLNVLSEWNIDITDRQLEMFEKYYEMLVVWNTKFNLTSITEKEDVYIKHFADSIAVLKYIDLNGSSIIDVGTGAGFPGIPVRIMCPDCHIVLADSLNKRVGFLNEVINELGLSDIYTVHGRAEDLAFVEDLRERFDIAFSRAVSNLSTLSEYCLPFVKIKGRFISYKSGNVDDELSSADNAIGILGGRLDRIEKFEIPGFGYDRSFVFIDKCDHTLKKYPRKAGTPLKNPL